MPVRKHTRLEQSEVVMAAVNAQNPRFQVIGCVEGRRRKRCARYREAFHTTATLGRPGHPCTSTAHQRLERSSEAISEYLADVAMPTTQDDFAKHPVADSSSNQRRRIDEQLKLTWSKLLQMSTRNESSFFDRIMAAFLVKS